MKKPMDKSRIFTELVKKELGPLVCNGMKDVADRTIQQILVQSCDDLMDKEMLKKYSDNFYWNIAYVVDHAIAEIFYNFSTTEEMNND